MSEQVNIEQVREALGAMSDKFVDVGVNSTLYYSPKADGTVDVDTVLEFLGDCEQMADEIERLRSEVAELKGISCALWKIIDDIDTYSDMTKGNYEAFYEMAMKRQSDKSKTGITSDGYGLFLNGKRIDREGDCE